MDKELKQELRLRIPVVAFSAVVGAVTTLLMKPFGFSPLETFIVGICMILILEQPITDISRMVRDRKSGKENDED